MKKAIYIIVGIILVIFILLGVLLTMREDSQTNLENNNHLIENNTGESDIIGNKIERVTNRDMFFTVASCVENYLNMVTQKETDKLYNLLYDEYKQRFEVTQDNIYEHVGEHVEYQIFKVKEMYKLEKLSNNKYFVYGTIRDDTEYSNNEETDYYVTVVMDTMNGTFSIMPNGFMFANDLEVNLNTNNLDINVTGYTCYMNQCDIELTIKNKTQNTIDLSDGIYLTNYENEEQYELINQQQEKIILPNEEKNIQLSFHNSVTTPKNIIFNYENNEITIPIIRDYENKN